MGWSLTWTRRRVKRFSSPALTKQLARNDRSTAYGTVSSVSERLRSLTVAQATHGPHVTVAKGKPLMTLTRQLPGLAFGLITPQTAPPIFQAGDVTGRSHFDIRFA